MQEKSLEITILIEVIEKFKEQKKMLEVPIERDEIKEPATWALGVKGLRRKQKKENTGIQVTISDDPYPIVTHLQALTREELPLKYLNSHLPKVWLEDGKLFSGAYQVLLEKNKEHPYSSQEIADALLHIRLAGEHLAAVTKPKTLYLKYCQAATFKDGKLKSRTSKVDK